MVNADYVGREFHGTPPYVVSAAKISEFADAVAADSPIHRDAAAARARGYADVVAPPTFAVVIAQRAEAEYIEDPGAAIDFSRVVHANETFTPARPLVAGDEISTVTRVVSIATRASITMVTTRVDLTDAAGVAVGSVESTLAVRGEDA
ncbi:MULTISPECIES: MaoC family dehydratase N-terminal domain-containing protein [unclassified Pseudactinotalea]|uniref:FAS1-like dehydratase domain-containing protein n=1 Tax=unclassified Pseudactinotalea TaxID=2649176 RepID=UPI00128D82E9|nr:MULTISPECIES: MaoC family dehydratase N-terminal domain-containing protein [unclassified Pseudactinotalea]MPV50969.1 MaoC family dehydratase [Pseudactinotalea sp. HY160]QGH70448.1 MaoC family dehydratase [Pseudactinotalea sp. HY158]